MFAFHTLQKKHIFIYYNYLQEQKPGNAHMCTTTSNIKKPVRNTNTPAAFMHH